MNKEEHEDAKQHKDPKLREASTLQKRHNTFVFVAVLAIELCAVTFLFKQFAGLDGWYLWHISNSSTKSVVDEPLIPKAPSFAPSSAADTNNQKAKTNPSHHYSLPPNTTGLAPVLSRIPTTEPVVFLGIDDGVNKQSFELQMMANNHIKASLFLTYDLISNDPHFFSPFVKEGSLIEDHTLDHALLPDLSYDQQKQEICGTADQFTSLYGRRPVLFRPPGGSYNDDTQRAAADCGMKAVILWVAKANGGSMQYQVGDKLRPGDIVLMHFRPEFQKDMQAFIKAQTAAGLHTELLENWLN